MSTHAREASPGSPTVVVGGGVAGLAAAHALVEAGRRVLLLEASPELGGKLRTAEVGGVAVDVGAEAMLARRPEGVALVRAAGLPVVHPAVVSSRLWVRGALRPLPRSLMGVPLDPDQLAGTGLLDDAQLARVRAERDLPPEVVGDDADATVGELVDRRFGPAVTDLLVEPLLGGVYAGHARALSARAAVPQLLTLATRGSVLAQAPGQQATHEGPVFAGVAGGVGRLPAALAAGLEATGRAELRTAATVRALRRTPEGFALVVGPTTAEEEVRAAAVVLAVPPAAAARLLREVAPLAADEVGGVETASVAVVTLAYRAADALPLLGEDASGFLVPPVEGRAVKASTFSYAKWAWVREAGRGAGPGGEDLVHLRTSLGRHGEETALQADDAALVRASRDDLRAATGLDAVPVDTHVQRWGGGLPQYALGHVARVARARAAVAAVPGLAVCGAAYDGVGIPAVVASAQRAVRELEEADATRGGSAGPGTMEP
ncbi:protoporphyrinogen oxidase [Nocardioides perillae]|uniref:Coproporphyrinogen III oxidase n=1 Tax=Nocardioides perillae TaxID=1119534 RepID=A0A7Y9RZM1_9ACTN|nr:oxygen-dependent protoporphyrinogen oxidase [Nocardioides perillae]